jgi:hypothetical protein
VKFFETYLFFLAQYTAIATLVAAVAGCVVFLLRRRLRAKKAALQTLVKPISSATAHVAETAVGAVKSGAPRVQQVAAQSKVALGDALNKADPHVRRGLQAGKLFVGDLASRGAEAWSRYRQK